MTYSEMVQGLGVRLGGTSTLQRFLDGEVDYALNESQKTVYFAMAAAAGLQGRVDIRHESEVEVEDTMPDGTTQTDISTIGHRGLLTDMTSAISSSADCLLPEHYHLPVVIGAAMVLR